MIKAAEATGTMPEALSKIADLKKRDMDFNSRIRSALAYPVLLLSVGAMTLIVLTTFVLPKFITLFNDLEQQLPVLTQILIKTSLFLRLIFPEYTSIALIKALSIDVVPDAIVSTST